MADWLSTLPKPLVSGYKLMPVDPVIRTEMEVGATRARRITAARNDKLDVTWAFTDAQMTSFRTWFDDPTQAAGGSGWFNVSLLIGTSGVQTVEAKFASIWQASLVEGLAWRVSAKLEVR